MPSDREALERFARFLGFAGRDDFAEHLLAHLRTVERHYVRLFERAPAFLARQQNLSFSTPGTRGRDARSARRSWVSASRTRSRQAVRRWRAAAYRALRGEQARGNLTELLPLIIDQFSRAEHPDAAFAAFDRFLAGYAPAGVSSRCCGRIRKSSQFVALILGVAPRLADMLAHNPHLIDLLIDPSFFGALPDENRLADELTRALGDTRRYEGFLDAIRLFGQEHMFLIGAQILSGSVSAEQAGEVFARLADVLIRALHARVQDDFAAAHGRIRGEQTAILALGRLGAREMTANSDLDLIVIYDFDQEHPELRRQAAALRRPIFRAPHPTADQRAHRADQLRRALPGRYAAAPLGPLRSAGDADRRVCKLPGPRGVDLGAHGAHPRACRLGVA